MMTHFRPFVGAGLSLALFAGLPLPAQSPPSRVAIVVIQGEGAIYRVGQRAGGLAVRVEDEEHRPLAGAGVTFALPASGASGEFVNGSQNFTIVTNDQGVAATPGFRLNQAPGKLQVYVTASYQGLHATELIDQVVEGSSRSANAQQVQPRKSGHKWVWVVVGLLAAAGAEAGYYYSNTHGTASGSSISITAGSPVIGGPH